MNSKYYVIDTNKKTYHRPDCHQAPDIRDENAILASSGLYAFARGNKPCEVCKPELPEFSCPKCGAPMVLRKGRQGVFYGCSNFPYDKFTISWESALSDLESRLVDIESRNSNVLGLPEPLEEESYQPELSPSDNQEGHDYAFIGDMTETAIKNAVEKRPIRSRLLARWKLIAAILVLIGIGSYSFFLGMVNVVDEYKLNYTGKTTLGYITFSWEDVEDVEGGGIRWISGVTYSYQIPDGREFTGESQGDGRLKPEFRFLTQPYPVEITYLPDHPMVSRISADLPDNTFGLIRSFLFPYGFVSIFLWFIGFYLLYRLVREEYTKSVH